MDKLDAYRLEVCFSGNVRDILRILRPGEEVYTVFFDEKFDGEIEETGEEIDVPAQNIAEAKERAQQVLDEFYDLDVEWVASKVWLRGPSMTADVVWERAR